MVKESLQDILDKLIAESHKDDTAHDEVKKLAEDASSVRSLAHESSISEFQLDRPESIVSEFQESDWESSSLDSPLKDMINNFLARNRTAKNKGYKRYFDTMNALDDESMRKFLESRRVKKELKEMRVWLDTLEELLSGAGRSPLSNEVKSHLSSKRTECDLEEKEIRAKINSHGDWYKKNSRAYLQFTNEMEILDSLERHLYDVAERWGLEVDHDDEAADWTEDDLWTGDAKNFMRLEFRLQREWVEDMQKIIKRW